MKAEHIPFFIAGACSALNFARTAWVYPDISRWFYLGDAVCAVFLVSIAIRCAEAIRERKRRR